MRRPIRIARMTLCAFEHAFYVMLLLMVAQAAVIGIPAQQTTKTWVAHPIGSQANKGADQDKVIQVGKL